MSTPTKRYRPRPRGKCTRCGRVMYGRVEIGTDPNRGRGPMHPACRESALRAIARRRLTTGGGGDLPAA